jgi:hypothetical protein
MDLLEYKKKLTALFTALESNPRFRVVSKLREPYSEQELEEFEGFVTAQAGPEARVLPYFRDFYSVMNGFRLQWQYLGPEPLENTTASTQIAMLAQVYLPEDATQEVLRRIYDEPRVFDLIGPDDHVSIQLHRDHSKPQLLYFADVTQRYHELSLDAQGYLAMVLEARAMYRWQHFFVGDPDFPLSKEMAETFRHDLHFLFPEADLSLFKAPQER